MPPIHVVFGAGQVGAPLARRLAARGHQVRVVTRSGAGGAPGAVAVQADALDPAASAAAAAGAAALYHCMNPPYDGRIWADQLPRIAESLIAAAASSGARLVVLDNLYGLGRPRGRPLDESRPMQPCSRKGEIRARVGTRLLEAHRNGEARVAIARASDFFGPGGVNTYFERRFWTRLLAGKSVPAVVNPDTRHSYHFIPDVAAGLQALGDGPEQALGKAWMLPAAPAVSTRQLVAMLAAASGRSAAVKRLPRLLLSAAAPFSPLVRELLEMDYQWDEDFAVDDRRFREAFGLEPTPLDEAARLTAAWAAATYGAGAGG
jgi:nucleoside-diphosphate-sugar epimerase